MSGYIWSKLAKILSLFPKFFSWASENEIEISEDCASTDHIETDKCTPHSAKKSTKRRSSAVKKKLRSTPRKTKCDNNTKRKTLLTCQKCGAKFSSIDTLRRHDVRYHLGRKISCALCDMKFVETHNLKLHMRKGHGQKNYNINGVSCCKCGKLFPNRLLLVHHKKTVKKCLSEQFKNMKDSSSQSKQKQR